MRRNWALARFASDHALHWLVLAVIMVYTYARLFEVPYSGFELAASGRVVDVFAQGGQHSGLQRGDLLLQVGDLKWSDFRADYSTQLFAGVRPGDTIPLVIDRDGARSTVLWKYPGPNVDEFVRRLLSAAWLAYVFWFVGVVTAFNLRPKSDAWALAIAFCYFIAILLSCGGEVSFHHIWFSSYVFMTLFWLGLPMCLHFHWVWPLPLPRPPVIVWWLGYVAAAAIPFGILLHFVPLSPESLFRFGYVIAIAGTLLLLALHAILQPSSRKTLRWLLLIVAVAMLPLGAYPLLNQYFSSGVTQMLTSTGLLLIPFAYTLAAFRGQLGWWEYRKNRLTITYAFLAAVAIVVAPIIILAALRASDRVTLLVVSTGIGIVCTLAGIYGYPLFQSFVERQLLRIPFSSIRLVETYSARIAGLTSVDSIVPLLRELVLPSLLVRQFAYVYFAEGLTFHLFTFGLEAHLIPDEASVRTLLAGGGGYRPRRPTADTQPFAWIRLIVPMKIHEKLIGAWLFGRRDPDDNYPEDDVDVIQSLADATAIVRSNLLQAQHLRDLYQANVTRTEEERLRLAHALHDNVLNQLAAVLMKVDGPSMTPALQASVEELSSRLRAIVSDLRPPMLAYGLKPALEELVEKLSERSENPVKLSLVPGRDDARYPDPVELHLFRITQESAENAVRHARATDILITANLAPDRAVILIQDNGIGFQMPEGQALEHLIAQRHFGLAGIYERANLVGAALRITSAPGKGTLVVVSWRQPPDSSGVENGQREPASASDGGFPPPSPA